MAKFLGCEKTLVKNPSEAQQNLWWETFDWIWIFFFSFFFWVGGGGDVQRNKELFILDFYKNERRKQWGAEEEKKTWELPANKRG